MVSFQRSSSRSVGDNDSLDSDSTPRRLNSSSSWRQLQRRRNSGGGSRGGSRGSTATLSRSGGSGSCLSSSGGSSYSSSSSSWRSAASSRSSGASSCPSFQNPGETRGGRRSNKDSSIEVPRSRLTTRALRAFERSTEEHCRMVHQEGHGKIDDKKADDVDFPTCLMVLPYELKPASEADRGSGGNRNRRGSITSGKRRRKKKRNGDAEAPPPPRRWVVANEGDAELAERVGRCLLEVNAATARLSFHLRMHRVRAAHHGCNPEAFEALLRRWVARSRTEPPHLIATEIVTYLNCHPRYLGVCREMLLRQRCGDERRRRSTDVTTDAAGGGLSSCGDNGGGGGFCLLDDPDPVGAAAEELARATDDLRDCYREPTLTSSKSGARAAPGGLRDRGVHYLYLVDEFRRSVASPASPSSGKGATSASGDRDGGDYSSSDDSNDMFGSMSLYPLRIGGSGGGDDDDQNGGRDEHDDDDDSSSSNHDALRSVFFPFMNLTVMTVASGAGDEGGDTLSGLARLLGLPPKSGSDSGVPDSWVRAAGAGLIHGPGEGGYSYGGGGGCRGSLVEFARLQLDVERRRRAREAALRRPRRREQKQVRFQVSQCSSSSSVGRCADYNDRRNDEDDSSSSDGSASGLSSGSSPSPSFSPEWRQLQRFFRGRDPRGRYADLVRVVAVDEGVGGVSSYGLPSGSYKEFTSSSSSTAIWTSRDVAVAIQRDDVRSIAAVAAARKEKKKNRTGNGGSRRRSSQEKLLSTAEMSQGGQPRQGYGKAAVIGGATGGAANQNSSACLTRACSMSNFLPSPFRGGKRSHTRFGGKVNASASTMDSSISSADLAGGGTAESIATRSIPSVIETKLSLQATKAAGSVRGALMRTSSMPKIAGSSFRARFLGGGGGGGGPSKKNKKIGKRGGDGGASSRERDGYRSMGEGFDDFEEF